MLSLSLPSHRTTAGYGLAAALFLAPLAGCTMKQTQGSRGSGQSHLMDGTFAGQNACNPDEHTKPFVIEWDATEMSSFESLATDDIVFVKYEGCKLRILDECKNDSVSGEQGAYKPPEWTTGQLETVDISNSGELAAKLPLAQATLGARVSGGESFHMEYYVAGTRYASRDAVYETDLEGRYGCADATHFVYGYNLGAFALGSANELNIEAGGSAFGFGASGNRNSSSQVAKKGGELSVCREDSLQEVSGCRSPIRLNLRKIRPGDSPETTAMAQPDTAASASAAGMVNDKLDANTKGGAHLKSATQKLNARDGRGCIKELDAHDRLRPHDKSTDPEGGFAMVRARCVMLAGKCSAGKVQFRKALEKTSSTNQDPSALDRSVDWAAAEYCQGKMSATDAVRTGLFVLQRGSSSNGVTAKECTAAWNRVKKNRSRAKPRDEDDTDLTRLDDTLPSLVPACFARAKDCKAARKAFNVLSPASKGIDSAFRAATRDKCK